MKKKGPKLTTGKCKTRNELVRKVLTMYAKPATKTDIQEACGISYPTLNNIIAKRR